MILFQLKKAANEKLELERIIADLYAKHGVNAGTVQLICFLVRSVICGGWIIKLQIVCER